jgi:SAM-dependent methyltransferase
MGSVQPKSVLEVGCGSGIVLSALAKQWRRATFVGLEAAFQLAAGASALSQQIDIRQGFLEDLTTTSAIYDLIIAINVLEHAADPVVFLSQIQNLLAPSGFAFLVLPAAHKPNLELLFLDHIHSFTPLAIRALANRSGLSVIGHELDSPGLGDFQIVLLSRRRASPELPTAECSALGYQSSYAYLSAWQALDRELLDRCGQASEVAMFGAGEAAALIRAYAPSVWSRTRQLIVDDTTGARKLGRPVQAFADSVLPREMPLIIATHPRSHGPLAERLAAHHDTVVRFDDWIPR